MTCMACWEYVPPSSRVAVPSHCTNTIVCHGQPVTQNVPDLEMEIGQDAREALKPEAQRISVVPLAADRVVAAHPNQKPTRLASISLSSQRHEGSAGARRNERGGVTRGSSTFAARTHGNPEGRLDAKSPASRPGSSVRCGEGPGEIRTPRPTAARNRFLAFQGLPLRGHAERITGATVRALTNVRRAQSHGRADRPGLETKVRPAALERVDGRAVVDQYLPDRQEPAPRQGHLGPLEPVARANATVPPGARSPRDVTRTPGSGAG